eukprot:GFUD01014475.1.p1 GENE.GFUD01014475.1~~GFUD01014475.1.p1  ORF type:complete len:376 (+),score=120.01 GFUD01014475.1:44-1171(+)
MNTLQRMQTLVGAAGEALGITEDPLDTLVGSRIDEATRDNLEIENWALYMEICDIINNTEEGPQHAVKAIRRKLQQSMGKNSKTALFTLTILETCVKNCRKSFRILICQRDFVTELVNLDCPLAIKEQVLAMVQSWAQAFSSDPELFGVSEIYAELKMKGLVFPTPSTQDQILVTHSNQIGHNDNGMLKTMSKARRSVSNSGKLGDDQVRKLKQDLEITQGNLDIFNELLTELKPGEEHPEDKKLLEEVSATCTEMQTRVLDLIGVVENRELTSILLDINDNMNNQLLRFERYNNNVTGKAPTGLSTDDIMLEVPLEPEPQKGAASLADKTLNSNMEYQEIDLWGKDETAQRSVDVNFDEKSLSDVKHEALDKPT